MRPRLWNTPSKHPSIRLIPNGAPQQWCAVSLCPLTLLAVVSCPQNPKNRGLCHETYSAHSFAGPAAVAAGHRPVSNAPCLREKDGVDSSTAIQETAPSEAAPSEAAPSEAAPSEAAPSEAAPSEAAPLDSAVAAPAAVSGSIDTDGFPLTDGQQQALHRYMTAYYTRRRAPTAYSAPTTSPPMSRRLGMILRSLGRG